MSTTPAEHLRDAILDVLAQSDPALSSSEIYDRIDSAESKQSVYAQINYLKKSGTIDYWQTDAGTLLYSLAVPVSEPLPAADQDAEIETDNSQPVTVTVAPTLDLPDADLHRIVWSQPCDGSTRFLTLTVNDAQPRLNTSGAFAIDSTLLRQMADLIEVLQQKAA